MNNVVHDEQNLRFYIDLSKDDSTIKGVLLYERTGDNHIDFYHTEVPKELRGRGIGGNLAKAGLDYIRDSGLTATLSCSFIKDFGNRYYSREELNRHVKP